MKSYLSAAIWAQNRYELAWLEAADAKLKFSREIMTEDHSMTSTKVKVIFHAWSGNTLILLIHQTKEMTDRSTETSFAADIVDLAFSVNTAGTLH